MSCFACLRSGDVSYKRLERGKWSLERNILKPGPPRVRNAPSCAGQARGGRGPNILIDVTPASAVILDLHQKIFGIENY